MQIGVGDRKLLTSCGISVDEVAAVTRVLGATYKASEALFKLRADGVTEIQVRFVCPHTGYMHTLLSEGVTRIAALAHRLEPPVYDQETE